MNYIKGQIIEIDRMAHKCFCADEEYAVFALISVSSHFERMSFRKGNVKVMANTGPMYFEIGAKSENISNDDPTETMKSAWRPKS